MIVTKLRCIAGIAAVAQETKRETLAFSSCSWFRSAPQRPTARRCQLERALAGLIVTHVLTLEERADRSPVSRARPAPCRDARSPFTPKMLIGTSPAHAQTPCTCMHRVLQPLATRRTI